MWKQIESVCVFEKKQYSTSGVIRTGGFSVGFACSGFSSGNLPLPKASAFLASSAGVSESLCIFKMFRRIFCF